MFLKPDSILQGGGRLPDDQTRQLTINNKVPLVVVSIVLLGQ